jgi:hypothetical protein
MAHIARRPFDSSRSIVKFAKSRRAQFPAEGAIYLRSLLVLGAVQ